MRSLEHGDIMLFDVCQFAMYTTEAQEKHQAADAGSYDEQQQRQRDPQLWTSERWGRCGRLSIWRSMHTDTHLGV